jgi:hypothetical protein
MKYIFAIDETGNFFFDNWSSVCGVLIKGNELALKKAYQDVYKEFGFSEPVPNDVNGLLTTKENIEDKARFHFNKMNDSQKTILKNHLLPFVDKLFVSRGKPSLFANNQSWWLIAVSVVIKEFLRTCKLEKGDEVEILMDNRHENVFGVSGDIEFKDYHNLIKAQIENNVKRFIPNNNLKIEFRSDTSSLFVNLADVCCGFRDIEDLRDKKIECKCSSMYDYLDPIVYKDQNPLVALNIIIQEIDNDNFKNLSYVENILEKLRKKQDDYSDIWTVFYDFLKSKITKRNLGADLGALRCVVNIFLKEFKVSGKDKIKSSQSLELMILFTEYFSHIGDINIPFDRESFIEELQKCDKDSETRLLRKWEKLVSYTLREAQIHFNAYDFNSANDNLEDIWEKHTNLLSDLKDVLGEKDEPTTALLGSLAQSFAFNDNFNEALDYFELSKQYAIKSSSTTDSYIFTIYHKQENIEKCREYFELMCGKTPEQYREDNEIGKVWTLVAYCKLRALELYKNKQTNLKAIDLQSFENYNSGYPFTLAMKWEAIALVLENGDKQTIEKYFSDAIGNMLNENNEFAIRTLTLSLIQCYGLVNNQNPYHRQYNTYLRELKNSSKHFEKYVDEKSPLLNNIKNDADIWERALSLPFYYA